MPYDVACSSGKLKLCMRHMVRILLPKWRPTYRNAGPIVRISPDEIHINDPFFYDTIYSLSAKSVDKYDQWVKVIDTPESTFSTVGHDLHRLRRGALHPFFAKRSVYQLEDVIQAKVYRLIELLDASADTNEVFKLDTAFVALTGDVISQYAFGTSFDFLDGKDPGAAWKATLIASFDSTNLTKFFPWLNGLFKVLPSWVASLYPPQMNMMQWQSTVRKQVEMILAEGRDTEKGSNDTLGPTIFHSLRDSDLPLEERSLTRLCDEAQIISAAGTETTAKALYTTLFYVASDRRILHTLREELRTLPLNAKLQYIERLPYLTAVIKEGLRLSFGATFRLPRVFSESIKYGDWVIPPRTPISETIPFVSLNETIFPSPYKFSPERWTDAENQGQRLDRFLVSFSKGTRACIGLK